MRKLAVLLSVLLVLMFVVISFGCDQAKTIMDEAEDIIDKAEEIASSIPTDSDTNDVSPTLSPAMDINSWIKVNTGEWEQTDEGVKVWGAGHRFPHQGLLSKDIFNFMDSETLVKWKANGGSGNYAQFGAYLMGDYDIETGGYSTAARAGFFTTDHSWNNSLVINENTWYYTRFTVNADGTYTTATSTGNYDINGGALLYESTDYFENADSGSILVLFNDNYGGTETNVLVGEVVTSAGSTTGTTVTSDQPKILEAQNAGIKTILVFPQPGITNATVNDIPIFTGQDNQVQIDTDQPLQMEYNFVNEYGNLSEATQDLDTYYDFHVLKANGGWASTIHRSAYDTDKNSP